MADLAGLVNRFAIKTNICRRWFTVLFRNSSVQHTPNTAEVLAQRTIWAMAALGTGLLVLALVL